MFERRFNVMDTHVKSSFKFRVPEVPGWRWIPQRERRSLFRDPAALPMLEKIADALQGQGYSVTKPRTGKACHGAFDVAFPNVSILVILLVSRRGGMVDFRILSWPYQSLRQRWRTRGVTSPDFVEWDQVCGAIYDVLSKEINPESLRWLTFKEAEDTESAAPVT